MSQGVGEDFYFLVVYAFGPFQIEVGHMAAEGVNQG